MYRSAQDKLVAWKSAKRRKPLILQGARQVGKTWLVQEFGRTHYEKTAYVSFQGNVELKRVYDGSLSPERLLEALSIESGTTITPDNTLIVLDEIQECPRALMSLKGFQEQAAQYDIIAAGSLLGVALHQGVSFPVGKVTHLDLYPLTFTEFLIATGNEQLVSLMERRDFSLTSAYRDRLIELLKKYCFIGGMPEAVMAFIETGDFGAVRSVQSDLLYDYDHDFSKYASGELAERIRLVWEALPSQLAKENKKFVYNAIRPSARAREFELAIRWLEDSGLALRVPRVSKPGIPLSAYQDLGAFKLFALDVGLLAAKSGLGERALLQGDALFEEFKGSLTEQFVCQQLVATGLRPFYWSAERSSGEVDFIFESSGKPIPVEVKAGENVRSKSLGSFLDKYQLSTALRLSLSDFRQQERLTNLPLYAIGILPEFE
ncbi:MAG: ATP-binding protein [Eggerthellaceae bacterium]|nr:ATP-binding protein [Eggerthellaceae bacterium]